MKKLYENFGLPRLIVLLLFILLFVVAGFMSMDIPSFFGDVLRRWGMFGILVLAMVPGIQSGIGPNFGVTVGIVGGMLGAVLSIEMRFRGWFDGAVREPVTQLVNAAHPMTDAFTNVHAAGHYFAELYAAPMRFLDPVRVQISGVDVYGTAFTAQILTDPMIDTLGLAVISAAILMAILFGTILGIIYGMVLNRVKGSEMAVSVYVGFSAVNLFNILWALIPVSNSIMILPATGRGLRQMINLQDDFGDVFNRIFRIQIGTFSLHTGILIVFFLFCFGMYIFTRTRTGMMMSAAGSNPSYARASGINVDKMRLIGTSVSTALGAVGIIVYAQSFGFLQMYGAPLTMGFTIVAGILIGGATVKRARVLDVLIGAFLFHGIMVIALPLAIQLIPNVAGVPEMLRLIITNGIILYALTRVHKGGSK